MSKEFDKMSASTDSENSDGVDWQDVEPDEEQITFVSLFGPETFATIGDLLQDCKTHNFDLAATTRRLNLEFHDTIKLVNFVRSCVQENHGVPDTIRAQDFADDAYLKPVLENDALLFSLDEILSDEDVTETATSSAQQISLENKNKELEIELDAVKERFASYRLAVEETLDKRWGDDNEPGKPTAEKKKDSSDYYFESYAYNGTRMIVLQTGQNALTHFRYPRNYAQG